MFDEKEYKQKQYQEKREYYKQKARDYYYANREKILESKKTPEAKQLRKKVDRNYASNPKHYVKLAYIACKYRAKKRGLDFNIEENDIQIPTQCPVLNIPLTTIKTGGPGGKSNSPSIDRIDNSKGYIKGNIQIMSHKANMMKSSATPEELLKFAYWVILTYGHMIDEEIN